MDSDSDYAKLEVSWAQMVFNWNFFKKFWPKICQIIMPTINNIWKGEIPPSRRYTFISLLLKKDKKIL